jgi:hypothetical protein
MCLTEEKYYNIKKKNIYIHLFIKLNKTEKQTHFNFIFRLAKLIFQLKD